MTIRLPDIQSLIGIDTKKVEARYKAKYVMDTCVRGKYNNWVGPVALFYQEEAYPENGSHYFALLFNPEGTLMITDGRSAVDHTYSGVLHEGLVYHSRYRHDFRPVPGADVCVDGGLDYLRMVGDIKAEVVQFKIIDGELIEVRNPDDMELTVG